MLDTSGREPGNQMVSHYDGSTKFGWRARIREAHWHVHGWWSSVRQALGNAIVQDSFLLFVERRKSWKLLDSQLLENQITVGKRRHHSLRRQEERVVVEKSHEPRSQWFILCRCFLVHSRKNAERCWHYMLSSILHPSLVISRDQQYRPLSLRPIFSASVFFDFAPPVHFND
ncbi:hypothetical protein EV356DRAFT_288482 [Viridothelium virens]|uniref:Uncharacterized protein n=1 Tax=Viridothelium virens TaxID=1048519 RepID=A0A6A6H0E0_VIRVR|nr:hypothetical protein EV356DRAFT_288482 [Viridothelium virens]